MYLACAWMPYSHMRIVLSSARGQAVGGQMHADEMPTARKQSCTSSSAGSALPWDAAVMTDHPLVAAVGPHGLAAPWPPHAPEVVTKRRFWSMKVTVLTAPRW